jgi:predicted nucleic acid-binding Zn ribbon protein
VCEICGEGPVQRVLYPVAVHFKGSGFYSTDYGKGGGRKPSRDGEKSGGDSSSEKAEQTEKGEKKDKNVKKVAES